MVAEACRTGRTHWAPAPMVGTGACWVIGCWDVDPGSVDEVLDDGCGDFGGGGASSDVAGADPVAGGVLDGALDGFGLVEETEVLEHQGCAADRTDGVADPLPGDVGGGAVDRF